LPHSTVQQWGLARGTPELITSGVQPLRPSTSSAARPCAMKCTQCGATHHAAQHSTAHNRRQRSAAMGVCCCLVPRQTALLLAGMPRRLQCLALCATSQRWPTQEQLWQVAPCPCPPAYLGELAVAVCCPVDAAILPQLRDNPHLAAAAAAGGVTESGAT
jgi:hypothetical protein